MHLTYPKDVNLYSHEELLHLLKALGFPRNLFTKNISNFVESSVTVDSLMEMCDDRYFHNDLHNTVNMKSGGYNVETLRKSLQLVASKVFSFAELESIRLAFETYEEFDQRGMKARVPTLIKAFKTCGWVVSPLKLKNKLRHLHLTLREKGRIQFSEFLDLLTFCVRISDSEVELERVGATDKTSRNIYRLDKMKEMILPKDELICDILDREYVKEESQYKRPPSTFKLLTKKPVDSDHFQAQVDSACRRFQRTRNRLRNSAKQESFGGAILRESNYPDLFPEMPEMPSRGKCRKVSFSRPQQNSDVSRRSSASVAATMKSAPVYAAKKIRPKKTRAQSGPPVVNDLSRRELQKKVYDLQFNIETENQRWEDYARQEISEYIYNSDDVLERIRKPPPVPGAGKKRTKAHTQPPAKFTRRMAQPGPMLPRHHVRHCDAITQGLGVDNHATALQSYGVKVQRIVYKERKAINSSRSGGRFLETLLQDNVDSDVSTEPLEAASHGEVASQPIQLITISEHVSGHKTSHFSDKSDQDFKTRVPHSNFEIATSESWKKAKFKEAYQLLCNDTSRVFLDIESSRKTSHCIQPQVKQKSCGGFGEIFTLLGPLLIVEDADQSDFEKFLKSNDDFTIPKQEMRHYDDIQLDWLKYQRSFRRFRAKYIRKE